MADLERYVLDEETCSYKVESSDFLEKKMDNKGEFELVRYALDHVDREVFVFRLDGTLIFANRLAKERSNLSGDLSIYYPWVLDPTFTREAWHRAVEKMRKDGRERDNQLRFQLSDGTMRVIRSLSHVSKSASGEELFWVFCQDISAQESDKNKIKELNSIMNTVLDNIPVYLFVKDTTPDFRYVYWNKAFETYSHILREHAIGKTDYDIFPNRKDAERFRRDDNQLLFTGKAYEYFESYETPKGEIRTVKTLKTLVRDEDDTPLFLVGVSWDITDMKNSEQQLIMARMKAEQSDRLKSAFLANMSHEIRTPLNAIIGFAHLVAESDSPEEKEYYMNIVENNSELLTQLINDILDLSKIEAGSLEFVNKPVNVYDMCRKVQEIHQSRLKEDVKLLFDEGCEPLFTLIDGNRLFQVISNLITNASKFTKQGFIRFGYRLDGEYIKFYVEDTGCGIPKDKVLTIFDRFTKLNTFAQGSGLGLAICKMLVEKMGGKIVVNSEEEKGSIFEFTIPYQEIAIEIDINDMENNEIKEGLGAGRTILVAEDVESNYLLLKAIIGKIYNLIHAWNGKEAIEMFEKEKPDLILMDIKMPEMDGLEATRRIREISKSIPIIALTAFAFDDDRVKAEQAGCNDYLTKPLAAGVLKEMIIKYLQ